MSELSIWRGNRSNRTAISNKRNRRISRAAAGHFESLENRQLMSLLGVATVDPNISFDTTGKINYTFNQTTQTGEFVASATPYGISFSSTSGGLIPETTVNDPMGHPYNGNFTIDFFVNPNGSIVTSAGVAQAPTTIGPSGDPNLVPAPGTNLLIEGEITDGLGNPIPDPVTGQPDNGILVEGVITGFGYQYNPSGLAYSTNNFDFTFKVTGGLLAADYGTQPVAVTLLSQGNTFQGSFTNNFIGGAANGAGADGNFGTEYVGSSLSGNVYEDLDDNGTRNSVDQGIGNILVTLTGTDFQGVPVSESVLTQSTGSPSGVGSYSFTNLLPGNYTITESTNPSGLLPAQDTPGTLGDTSTTQANGGTTLGQFAGITVPNGSSGVNYNFGWLPPSSVAGVVFYDKNDNGTQDAGEPGISGVTVTLTGTNDLGQSINVPTTTDANGNYIFTGLRPSPTGYTITETQPAPYLEGKDVAGTGWILQSQSQDIYNVEPTMYNPSTTPPSYSALPPAGAVGINYNFGELLPSSISGIVFCDTNVDSQYETGEPLEMTTVTLTGTDETGAKINTSIMTSASGAYTFGGLLPGNYVVTQTLPAGHIGETATSVPVVLTASAGPTNLTTAVVNFADVEIGSVAGVVYNDANDDGIQDNGEQGIVGAGLTLTGTSYTGAAVSLTTTSGTGGAYTFPTVPPSAANTNYTVTVTSFPAGYVADKFGTGSLSVNVPGCNNGSVGFNMDQIPLVALSTISGVTYCDTNVDKTYDTGDVLESGALLTLSGTNDLGTAISATVTSGPNGAYTFSGLRPGSYMVTQTTPPPGHVLETAGTVSLTVTPGSALTANFGNIELGSVSGIVYNDANDNGTQDSGEAGIASASLTLTGTNYLGKAVSLTTTTNSSGAYTFSSVAPSQASTVYTITVTPPTGYVADKANTAGTQTEYLPGCNNTETGFNFGEFLPSSVSGTVYYDANNDGTYDTGDSPIANVTVTLTGKNDLGATINISTTTNSAGFYQFTGLRPSTSAGYTITETQPAPYLEGKDNLGSLGGNAAVQDVFSAIPIASNQNGINYNFGELLQLSPSISTTPGGTVKIGAITIGGTKYLDLTGNGFSSDDTAQSGVTMDLYQESNSSAGLQIGAGGDVLVGTATTTSNGSYTFNVNSPGTYYVAEAVPAGYIQTGGGPNGSAGSSYYTVTATAGHGYAGYNFDDYLIPTCAPTCVSYKVTTPSGSCQTFSTLAGNTQQGDTVTATFTITPGMTDTITLVSYLAPGSTFSDATAYQQVIYQQASGTYGPGTYSLTVKIPNSYYQIDFVCGTSINELEPNQNSDAYGPDSANILYHAEGRFISSDNSGTTMPTLATPVAPQTPLLTVTSTAQALTDSATLSGGTSPTGTIIFTLYSPTNTVVYTDTVTVTGDNTYYTSAGSNPGGYIPTTPGTYQWMAVYSGDTMNKGVTSPVGSEPEVVSAPAPIDLNVTKTVTDTSGGCNNSAGANQACMGDTVQYLVTVSDVAGYGAATTVTLSDVLPAGISYVSATPSQGTYNASTGVWTIGTINSGSSVTLTINAKTTCYGVFLNTATVAHADETDVNTNPQASVTLIVGASVTGEAWIDNNGDGLLDNGETGLSGMTVQLLNSKGSVVASTTSDTNGMYSFLGVAPGNYTVSFLAASGYVFTASNVGSNNNVDSDAVVGCNPAIGNACVTLVCGQTISNVDAGLYLPGTIGNFVFLDKNGNGVQDAGDSGVANVTVELLSANGKTVLATTCTNSQGYYSFTNLAPGQYMLQFIDPSGYSFTTENAGSNDALDSDVNSSGRTAVITLTAGEVDNSEDAGLIKTSNGWGW